MFYLFPFSQQSQPIRVLIPASRGSIAVQVMANPFDAMMKAFGDLYDNLPCARKLEKDHDNAEPIATTRAPIEAAPPPTPGPAVAAADGPFSPLLPENVTVPVLSRAASDFPRKWQTSAVASAIQQEPVADDYYTGNSLHEDFGKSAPLAFVAGTASAPFAPFATAAITAAAPPMAGLPVPGGLPPPPSPGPTVFTPPPTPVLTPASALANALGVPNTQTARVSRQGEEPGYEYYDYEYHYYSCA